MEVPDHGRWLVRERSASPKHTDEHVEVLAAVGGRSRPQGLVESPPAKRELAVEGKVGARSERSGIERKER